MSIRSFRKSDADQVNQVALAAFAQYEHVYDDWPTLARGVGSMAALAEVATLFVAEDQGRIVGAVAYCAPRSPRADIFEADWPIIRMLVVEPSARGRRIGRRLTIACIDRARADGAEVVALHTSPAMEVAFAMYLRMGFVLVRHVPDRFGVPYAVYVLDLASKR